MKEDWYSTRTGKHLTESLHREKAERWKEKFRLLSESETTESVTHMNIRKNVGLLFGIKQRSDWGLFGKGQLLYNWLSLFLLPLREFRGTGKQAVNGRKASAALESLCATRKRKSRGMNGRCMFSPCIDFFMHGALTQEKGSVRKVETKLQLSKCILLPSGSIPQMFPKFSFFRLVCGFVLQFYIWCQKTQGQTMEATRNSWFRFG